MIAIRYVDGRYAPVFVCDVCEQRITDWSMAAAVMRQGTENEVELLTVLHAHKGECHNKAEEKLGGRENTGWEELTKHILLLVLNCHLTPEILSGFRDSTDAAEEWPN